MGLYPEIQIIQKHTHLLISYFNSYSLQLKNLVQKLQRTYNIFHPIIELEQLLRGIKFQKGQLSGIIFRIHIFRYCKR